MHRLLRYDDANGYLGIDLNTTGHVAVLSNFDTGKIWKLGKIASHGIDRRGLQRQGRYSKVKQIKNRESRIVTNLNHNISKTKWSWNQIRKTTEYS
jgi:transposase